MPNIWLMTAPLNILIGSMCGSIPPAVATVTKVARLESNIILPENSHGKESRHELSRQQDLASVMCAALRPDEMILTISDLVAPTSRLSEQD
jgi:hypothetical protein